VKYPVSDRGAGFDLAKQDKTLRGLPAGRQACPSEMSSYLIPLLICEFILIQT